MEVILELLNGAAAACIVFVLALLLRDIWLAYFGPDPDE